jgi:hypothetical protein
MSSNQSCVLAKEYETEKGEKVTWMLKYKPELVDKKIIRGGSSYPIRIIRNLPSVYLNNAYYVTSPYVMWHPLSGKIGRYPIVFNFTNNATGYLSISNVPDGAGGMKTYKVYAKANKLQEAYDALAKTVNAKAATTTAANMTVTSHPTNLRLAHIKELNSTDLEDILKNVLFAKFE